MLIDALRFTWCRIRYVFLKRNTKVLPELAESVGETTLSHNMGALTASAAFGMANRMKLLMYPVATMLEESGGDRVLIVGPRTEDDLYLAWGLGMRGVQGLDLFSYSRHIALGDMHQTTFADGEFDAIILGWVISYSSDPERMVAECKRILKPGGLLAFGIESNPEHRRTGQFLPPRVNNLNSGRDIAELVQEDIAFIYDPELEVPTSNAVVFLKAA